MTSLVLNQIPAVQNEEPQLKLLRARKRTYAIATCLIFVQLGLTLGIPIIGTVLAAFLPQLKAYVAAASLAIVIIDPLILDRQQKVLMKRAAKIGEKFDCVVLDLPWDQFTVGEDVDPEDIHMAAKAFAGRCDDSGLRSWYPEVVGEVPLHLARIICQRTNLRYDSRLRRSYGAILQVVSLSLIGIFAIWGRGLLDDLLGAHHGSGDTFHCMGSQRILPTGRHRRSARFVDKGSSEILASGTLRRVQSHRLRLDIARISELDLQSTSKQPAGAPVSLPAKAVFSRRRDERRSRRFSTRLPESSNPGQHRKVQRGRSHGSPHQHGIAVMRDSRSSPRIDSVT
jgi:hypothetical protein